MQYYLRLYLDTDGNVTLSKLGEWEQDNPFEYEAYMTAYNRKLELEIKQRKEQSRRTRSPRRRR